MASSIEYPEQLSIMHCKNFDIELGDKIYYAKAYPLVDEYEVVELTVRTITADYLVAYHEKGWSFLIDFDDKDFGKAIHKDRKVALKVVKLCQKRKCRLRELLKDGDNK